MRQLALPEGNVLQEPEGRKEKKLTRKGQRMMEAWERLAETTEEDMRLASHLACWLCRRALIHFPKMSSEVLMFPASFRRSPIFWVFAHRSEPARSHRHNLQDSRATFRQ